MALLILALAAPGLLLPESPCLLVARPVSVLAFTGADRQRFLHGLCTADVTALGPGKVTDAVIVDAQGNTQSLLTLVNEATDAGARVVAYHSEGEKVKNTPLPAFFDKYIFPADEVEVHDESSEHGAWCYELSGTKAEAVMQGALGLSSVPILEPDHAARFELFGSVDALITRSSSLGYADEGPCFSVLITCGSGSTTVVEDGLKQLVASVGGEVVPSYEQARILRGRPGSGSEFGASAPAESVPPLSLGLWSAVSMEKGCYLGNEILARLAKAKRQKRELFGISFDEAVTSIEPGADVTLNEGDGTAVGVVTSVAAASEGPAFALALLRPAAAPIGTQVRVGAAAGRVTDLAFATRDGGVASKGDDSSDGEQEDAASDARAAKAAAEAERKAAKLAAMQAKLKAMGLA